MNTNGSSGGDTWGWECWGWALLAEQQEGEAPHRLLWGLLAPPEKHPEGKACRQPPQQQAGGHIQASGMLDLVLSETQGAKGLHPPQIHPRP